MVRLLPFLFALNRVAAFTPTSAPSRLAPLVHAPSSTHPTQSHNSFLESSHKRRQRLSRRHVLSEKESAELRKTASSKSINSVQSDAGLGTVALASKQVVEQEGYDVAIKRTLGWVGAAIIFGASLTFFDSPQTTEEFFAGYLLEQSLSVDNLLVFLLLFEYFQIPFAYQSRVLNWGIIGAIVMRAVMIGAGAVALQQFHGVLLIFAGILIYSSAKVLIPGDEDEEEDFSENFIVKLSNKFFQSTNKFDGDRFFTEENGIRLATPMLMCVVAVELSDVVFAVDSIPAVFGVTENPLVVFSSNMFAIMGLRSLYTILSKAASELEYLEPAVAVILGFIGSKMVAEYFGVIVPTEVSLGVVATLLSGGIVASLVTKDEDGEETA